MPSFTTDQWLIVGLVFLLGLVIGMMLMAGGKWKARYREEAARCAALEAENKKLRTDAQEMDSLRHAAARDEAARRELDRAAPVAPLPLAGHDEAALRNLDRAAPIAPAPLTDRASAAERQAEIDRQAELDRQAEIDRRARLDRTPDV